MSLLSILLVNGFVPKVKTGDDVVSGQVIATKRGRGKDIEINVCETLDIKPGEAVKFILKRPGDKVEEGGLIAAKKGTLGIGGKGIVSKVCGTVFKIDEDLGILYIRESQTRLDPAGEDIFSPVDGVVELCDNKKIAIKTDKNAILADKVCGKGIIQGQLVLVNEGKVEAQDLKSEIGEKIILGRVFDRETISKSIALSVLGIISQNISDEELEDLRKKNIDTPIFIINEENFEKLVKYNGKKIYADAQNCVIIAL